MKRYLGTVLFAAALAGPSAAVGAAGAQTPTTGTQASAATPVGPSQPVSPQPGFPATVVEVLGGTATFDVGTNIPAVGVHGKSANLRARAQIREDEEAITIEKMEATLPVKTLSTGLGLRDEHMRKYVFTTGEGQTPDLKFVADQADCARAAGGESTCKVSGQLAIRGTPRPFAMTLKVNRAGEGYRAAGDGTVKLSTYGIAQPSQFGVTTEDEVKLHLEFTAKPSGNQTAARRGGER
ncbi:MAG TPA: YceI family protein [Vicinamibacterales bacterium]|nr:YceI family protein [Vicinamibacterales bacterium]